MPLEHAVRCTEQVVPRVDRGKVPAQQRQYSRPGVIKRGAIYTVVNEASPKGKRATSASQINKQTFLLAPAEYRLQLSMPLTFQRATWGRSSGSTPTPLGNSRGSEPRRCGCQRGLQGRGGQMQYPTTMRMKQRRQRG